MANLPTVIFQFAMSPYENWQSLAWSGALLITLFVLILSIAARARVPDFRVAQRAHLSEPAYLQGYGTAARCRLMSRHEHRELRQYADRHAIGRR